MYGKIFDSIYDSTLADDWRALITFQQMIVLCDADGVIDMTPAALSRRTSIPVDIIKAGIEILEAPDPYSKTPDHEGRRIERIDDHRPWGWVIVNHGKYRALQDAETVREQTRKRVARHRAKKDEDNQGSCNASTVTVTDSNGSSRHTDTDTDTNKKKNVRFSDRDMKVAAAIYEMVLTLKPDLKPPNLSTWANTVRLMVERDKREHQQIVDLFKWANQHDFWHQNILSPETLRKQWDKLSIQRNANKNGGGRRLKLPALDEELAAFAAKNNLPSPIAGESYPQYRARLNSEIEKKVNNEIY